MSLNFQWIEVACVDGIHATLLMTESMWCGSLANQALLSR